MFGFFETTFFQGHNDLRHMMSRPEGDSLARFGEGLLPLDPVDRYGQTSPIFNYPYERTREALLKAAMGADPDPHLATTLRYANPNDGGWPMPTIATWMTYLPAGATTAPIRSTDGVIVCVAEGRGSIAIGGESFDFGEKDTITVPGWTWRSFRAETDCFLFHASDRVVHEKLGMYREERGGA
jgi:gentisate 1,2-dioxygenase